MAKVKTSAPQRVKPQRETADKSKPEADQAEDDQTEEDDQQDDQEGDASEGNASESDDAEDDQQDDDQADEADQDDQQGTETSTDSPKQGADAPKTPKDSKPAPKAAPAPVKQAGFAARTGRTSTAPVKKPVGTQRPYLDSPASFGVRLGKDQKLYRFGKGRTLLKHLSAEELSDLKAHKYVADNGAEIVE